jgi:hypothetical protein
MHIEGCPSLEGEEIREMLVSFLLVAGHSADLPVSSVCSTTLGGYGDILPLSSRSAMGLHIGDHTPRFGLTLQDMDRSCHLGMNGGRSCLSLQLTTEES